MGGQRDNQTTLPSGKTRYKLNSRMGGSQGQSGRLRKISTLQGLKPRNVATPTALPRPDCTQCCYIRDTLPSPSDPRNNTTQIQSPWRGRQRVAPKHHKKLLFKQLKNSPWFWHLRIQLLLSYNPNPENGYPEICAFAVFFRNARKISGCTLVRPWRHPDTFLSTTNVSKLMK
jgi:hypothetical protein